jgi:hypothetical protein
MKTLNEEMIGKMTLRLVATGKGFVGLLIKDRKQHGRIDGDDPATVWIKLREMANEASDTYFGFDGARSRFRQFFPQGFHSAAFEGMDGEREYKLKAKTKLDFEVPLNEALTGSGFGEAVLSVYRATNLLSPYEKTRLDPVLRGPDADAFIQAAARFAMGEIAPALTTMERLLRKYDSAKWTVTTYLPFLWRPHEHMFLKPMVTVAFAKCVGHSFAHEYSPALHPNTYDSLLNLIAVTKAKLSDLRPRDNIDLQSFVWTVGEYENGDEVKLEADTAGNGYLV